MTAMPRLVPLRPPNSFGERVAVEAGRRRPGASPCAAAPPTPRWAGRRVSQSVRASSRRWSKKRMLSSCSSSGLITRSMNSSSSASRSSKSWGRSKSMRDSIPLRTRRCERSGADPRDRMCRMAATTFTRMDESTAEQWAVIGEETRKNQGRVADRILMLLRSLGDVTDGFATDQLTHCLQTATLAELRRRRRRGDRRLAVPRHRQGHQRAQPRRHRRRDAEALRAPRRVPHDPAPPGLPGPPLLRPLRHAHRPAREVPRRSRGSRCASSSPTTGTRSRSIPTATPSRSSTSSRWCARCSRGCATRPQASGVSLVRSKEMLFIQNRSPVGAGPSGNRWPRCDPQRRHSTSVRTMPWLRSTISSTASCDFGA